MAIDKKEVLRYLGYRGQHIDENMHRLIDDCIEETEKAVQEHFLYNIFPIIKKEEYMELEGTNIVLKGKDIQSHLCNAKSCAVMTVTIGGEIEKIIRYYEIVNLTKAAVLDACATVAVEILCDKVEDNIKRFAEEQDLFITQRYSPGYGDFSIEIQSDILRVLGSYKMGLTCTDNFILMPRKSVTALIGIVDKEFNKKRHCKNCSNYKSCAYRKDEGYCDN
ncbi:methionine synthase [Haloimpatiens massiliensis]|uniref:methionine synthase n=1 Tax=Haloimpatiens massiliensis TaxID=1658110 RepID=UPI000C84161E|nr:methionine synthase [Haloimpatiens massiliensis]